MRAAFMPLRRLSDGRPSDPLSAAQTELPAPTTDRELRDWLLLLTGMDIPDQAVCPGHCAPLAALAHAYFARSPICVWHSSRGLGGKTTMLGLLAFLESIFLGADVTLLGGSDQQSKRISAVTEEAWGSPDAPRSMLAKEPIPSRVELRGGGGYVTLTASSRSTRGGHAPRLRIDEVDEVDLSILDAALGQPMERRGVLPQTVLSSTWHNPDGTMTEVMRRAAAQGWPLFRWCWKETRQGWLTERQLEASRAVVTPAMWTVEYDLQEPSAEDLAIMRDKVEACFDPALGAVNDLEGVYYEFEEPQVRGGPRYSHGADWAKSINWSIFWTIRLDCLPARLVAYRRIRRRPWPEMIKLYDDQVARYGGHSAHDSGGVGAVVADYMASDADSVLLTGQTRQKLFSDYILAIEHGDFKAPRVAFAYNEHKYLKTADLRPGGHPPDSFVAGALAWGYAQRHLDVRGTELLKGKTMPKRTAMSGSPYR